MSRRTLLTVVVLIALVAAVAVAVAVRQGRAEAAAPTPSPPLAGTTLEREPFDLTTTLGRPTVVNFFASWCPSCADEAADLAAFAAAHPDIAVIGVAINDTRADAERFVMRHGVAYPVVLDTTGIEAGAWGVTGIPATFFLDAQGRTVKSFVGPMTRDQFEQALDDAR